ncbi:hypothetical protein DPMN_102068 [Dreissena polymorpha]|uniref:Uncharacterized protein n=1 Tax=Dreissena polymorpha TaxID=45954 RepID=A0A9D4R8U8_DREPO|nr:hypothetical protein DPMN_102068 [Dreissena polymorpha]
MPDVNKNNGRYIRVTDWTMNFTMGEMRDDNTEIHLQTGQLLAAESNLSILRLVTCPNQASFHRLMVDRFEKGRGGFFGGIPEGRASWSSGGVEKKTLKLVFTGLHPYPGTCRVFPI